MPRKLIHPKLRTNLKDHWPSLCTIQSVNYTEEGTGQETSTSESSVTGMVNLPCRLGPLVEVTPTDDERRTSSMSVGYSRRNLKINAYLPQITPEAMVALVDGVKYQIRGVDSDSEHFSTRLRLEVVEPDGQ